MPGDDNDTTAEERVKKEGIVYLVELGADIENADVLFKKLYQNAISLIGNVQCVNTTKDKTPIHV